MTDNRVMAAIRRRLSQARLGFDLYCLSPVVHDDSFRVVEYDCIMRRPAGPARGAASARAREVGA